MTLLSTCLTSCQERTQQSCQLQIRQFINCIVYDTQRHWLWTLKPTTMSTQTLVALQLLNFSLFSLHARVGKKDHSSFIPQPFQFKGQCLYWATWKSSKVEANIHFCQLYYSCTTQKVTSKKGKDEWLEWHLLIPTRFTSNCPSGISVPQEGNIHAQCLQIVESTYKFKKV